MQNRKALLLASLFVANVLLPFNAISQSEPETFRGLKWRAPISDLPGAQFAEKMNAYDCYRRQDESKQIGDAIINEIVYCFYNNQFGIAGITLQGRANFDSLLKVFTEAYGPAKRPNRYIERYWWGGLHVGIYISLSYSPATGKATGSLMDNSVSYDVDKAANAIARDAAKDLK